MFVRNLIVLLALFVLAGEVQAQDGDGARTIRRVARRARRRANRAGDDASAALDDAEEAFDEAADEADEGFDEAEQAAVPAEKTKEKVQTLEEMKKEEDLWALLIGISAFVDVLWWFLWGWFIYVKTNSSDSTMLVSPGRTDEYLPISWFWGALVDWPVYWTALQYLWIFLFYMLISLPELVFWIMYMVEADMGLWLFDMWASYPGLYGSCVLYFFTIIWPAVQMSSLSDDYQAGFTNAALSLSMMLITWLYTGIVHILGYPYINRKLARQEGAASVEAKNAIPPIDGSESLSVDEVPEDGDDFVEDESEEDEAEPVEDDSEQEPETGADW